MFLTCSYIHTYIYISYISIDDLTCVVSTNDSLYVYEEIHTYFIFLISEEIGKISNGSMDLLPSS